MDSFKCPLCNNKYTNKKALYNHLEDKHEDQLNDLSPANFYFNFRNKKTHGTCIMCKEHTKFNETTEKYERLCSDKCKEDYRKMFRERMKKKYGREHLLNDPEIQKKMLANRKISGTYEWSDGSKEFTYTGSYEKDFLEFLDLFMNLHSSDVMCPAPQIIDYQYEGKAHFYIPDIYIQSIDLLIEIKASDNRHYRERDIEIEKIKDKRVKDLKINYFKVFDKKYDDFFNYLLKLNKK